MVVNRTAGMGLDPVTGTLIAQVGTQLISNLLGGGRPAGPSAEELARIEAERRRREEEEQRRWMYGAAIAGLGVVAFLVLRR